MLGAIMATLAIGSSIADYSSAKSNAKEKAKFAAQTKANTEYLAGRNLHRTTAATRRSQDQQREAIGEEISSLVGRTLVLTGEAQAASTQANIGGLAVLDTTLAVLSESKDAKSKLRRLRGFTDADADAAIQAQLLTYEGRMLGANFPPVPTPNPVNAILSGASNALSAYASGKKLEGL